MNNRIHKLFITLTVCALVSCSEPAEKSIEAYTDDYLYLVKEKDKAPDLYSLSLEVSRRDQLDLIDALSTKMNEAEVVHYLSFRLKNDIRLSNGQDTVDVVLCHFERSYHLKKGRTFHLTFQEIENHMNQPKTLIVNSPLFGDAVAIPLSKQS